jgi:hypothetical protein
MAPDVAAILRDESVEEPGLLAFQSLCESYLPRPIQE